MSNLLRPGLCLLIAACSAGAPFLELEEAGALTWLGEAQVSDTLSEDGIDMTVFDPASGPMCLRGGEFSVSVRDSGHEDLVIFLQGGGACWDEFCLSVESASPGIPERLEALDPELDYNPFRTQNLLYVPYCDGSLFAGEVDIDDDDDGEIDRFHRGHRNMTAAIEVAVARYPTPGRIILLGSSGGGYGTILATVMVRALYPGVPLYVVNDSGVGVGKGAEDPQFVRRLMEQWNATQFLPGSCPDCIADGHITGLVDWELRQDPDLKVAVFSSYQDLVISRTFLSTDPEVFEADLRAETSDLSEAHPGRYAPFLIEGEAHTTLLGNVSGFLGEESDLTDAIGGLVNLRGMQTSVVDGTDFATWVGWMLADDPSWVPLRE